MKTVSVRSISARTLMLFMGLAVLVSFALTPIVDEEELVLGLYVVASVAYWTLVWHAPLNRKAFAWASTVLPLVGVAYAWFVSTANAWLFHGIFIVALACAAGAMKTIRPDEPHLLQILLIPISLSFWFYGTMAVSGDWL